MAAAWRRLKKAKGLIDEAERFVRLQAQTEQERIAGYIVDGARERKRQSRVAQRHGLKRSKVASIEPSSDT